MVISVKCCHHILNVGEKSYPDKINMTYIKYRHRHINMITVIKVLSSSLYLSASLLAYVFFIIF